MLTVFFIMRLSLLSPRVSKYLYSFTVFIVLVSLVRVRYQLLSVVVFQYAITLAIHFLLEVVHV